MANHTGNLYAPVSQAWAQIPKSHQMSVAREAFSQRVSSERFHCRETLLNSGSHFIQGDSGLRGVSGSFPLPLGAESRPASPEALSVTADGMAGHMNA